MENVQAILRDLRAREASLPSDVKSEELILSPLLENVQLHGYQTIGVDWLLRKYHQHLNPILGDEMGLGKTLQIIAFIAALITEANKKTSNESQSFLIMAPLSVLPNWIEQFNRFAPSIDVFMYAGTKEERKIVQDQVKARSQRSASQTTVMVTSYEMVLFDTGYFSSTPWNLMVLDEGHRLKNPKGKLYGILMRDFQSVPHKVMLTGTPIQNNLQDLHALLSFLNPTIFTDQKAFQSVFREYFSAKAQQLHDAKSTSNAPAPQSKRFEEAERLMREILTPLLLLRTIQDVNDTFTLPPISETVVHAPMAPMQREYYKEIVAKNSDNINSVRNSNSTGSRISLINILPQLRKACNHPYMFPGAEPEPFCEGSHLYENSGKLYVLHHILPPLRHDGHVVLLFSQSTAFLDIIQDYLTFEGFSYERIDGSIRGKERWQAIDRFRRDAETFIFLISTRSGGVGLNLQRADTVIFVDSDYNPQADLQAVARAYRLGQTKPIHVIKFVSAHTVEEIIYRRAIRKMKMADKIRDCARRPSGVDDDDDEDDEQKLVELIQFGLHKLLEESSSDADRLTEPMNEEHIQRILARRSFDAQASVIADTGEDLIEAGGQVEEENMYYFEGEDYSKLEQLQQDADSLEALCASYAVMKHSRKRGVKATRRRRYDDDDEEDEGSSMDEQLALEDAQERERRRAERQQQYQARRLAMWQRNNYQSMAIEVNQEADDASSRTSEVDLGSTTPLQFKAGDASRPPQQLISRYDVCIIVHCVDTSGVWCDRGFFRSLSRRSLRPQQQYEAAARNSDLKLGQAHLIPIEENDATSIPTYVCLLVVQGYVSHRAQKRLKRTNQPLVRDGKSTTFRLQALDQSLQVLAQQAVAMNASVHMPRIGYGTPKFNWYAVERIIKRQLRDVGVATTIYYYSPNRRRN